MARSPDFQARTVVLKVRVPEVLADQLRAQALGLGLDTSALCAEHLANYPFTFALVPVRQAAPAPAFAPPEQGKVPELILRMRAQAQERARELAAHARSVDAG